MNKDELKNRISMALKDPILQQGFEIICKENAELKKQLGMSNKVYNDNLDYSHHIEEQLTKAKEILEDIIKFQPYIDRDAMFLTIGNDWKEVIFKAEQFLKE